MAHGKIWSFVISWHLVLLSITFPALSTTIEEALILTYQNNPELLAERENLKASHEEIPQAYSGWLPTASVDLSAGRERVKIGNAAPGEDNVNVTEFTLSQPVFSGFGTVKQTDKAFNTVNAARAGFRISEQDILLNTVKAYISLVEAQEVLNLSKKNESVLKEQLTATEEKFNLGSTTKTDVAQAQARLSQATSERIQAEGGLASARSTYKKFIGTDATNITLPSMLPAVPQSLKGAIDTAIKNNPELIEASYKEIAAKDQVGVSMSTILPSLDLVGKVKRSDRAATFGSGKSESDSLLLNFSIPLYQSGSEYSKVRKARIDAKQQQLEKLDIRNRIIEDVSKAWNELNTVRSTIRSNWDAVKAAELALEGVKQEAEQGERTTLDVLDAEQEMFESEVNLIQAKSSEVVAVYELKAAIGELNVVSLGLKIEPFNPDYHLNEVKYKVVGF